MLLGAGCGGSSSPFEQERSPVQGSEDSAEEDSQERSAESGEVTTEPASSTAPPEGETSVTPAPSTDVANWALVRLEDSQRPFAEEWTYDDAGRLTKARLYQYRRHSVPYYEENVTITYDGNHVVAAHDRVPEDLDDYTAEYELQAGNILSYTNVRAGEISESITYDYDAEGRLLGSRENAYGYEVLWILERTDGGEPRRLLRDGEVACAYSWRLIWLGTECYTDGVVTQIYDADASERLGHLKYTDSVDVMYTYDDAGRLTTRTSGANVVEYLYDAQGRLLEARDPSFHELRTYDDLGLLRESRWTSGGDITVATIQYERVSADEVIETETQTDADVTHTFVRTYKRLSQPPTGEPKLPSYWTILRMDQPSRYMAPTDYSKVP